MEEIRRVVAVHVVPPVAREKSLLEDRAVRAEEAFIPVVVVARMKYL